MTTQHRTHVLMPGRAMLGVGIPAAILVLYSRFGVRVIRGEECRAVRDQLAELAGPGELADLLRSGRPITVRAFGAEGWEVREHQPREG